MDWEAWARRAERAIDVEARGDWKGLFADGATFADPANPSTGDIRGIARDTRQVFPDWRQEITWIRGGDDWAVFEWIGRATYKGKIPIEMRGSTIVEVNDAGLVTRWQDYLDRKEPEDQIRRWYEEHPRSPG
jgi:hypothetical protein